MGWHQTITDFRHTRPGSYREPCEERSMMEVAEGDSWNGTDR